MRHFITFQKKKALYVAKGPADNTALAHELNHELMAVGFVLSKDAFETVASLEVAELEAVYRDIVGGIRRVVGADGYEPIYRNFPQSVLELSYEQFAINALVHYWTGGQWRPEDAAHIHREFAIEAADYTEVGLLTRAAFERIFHDLLYGKVSLSGFDKSCVDWYLDNGGSYVFDKITFKETAAYVGQRLLESEISVLPTRRATNVLRIWSAYSGGDEGLKENTQFVSPSTRQRALLLATLDQCGDLEDSFKSHREKWLRLLHYLHPRTAANAARYPTVAGYAERLRNDPGSLRTYLSRVEALIEAKDPALFAMLAKRPGAFMRRLDHLIRTFGIEALYEWLKLDPAFDQLITAYNHFAGRAAQQSGRGAVLASAARSEVVTYKALEPLAPELVDHITELLIKRLRAHRVDELIGPVFIDPGLYFTPLATNNRASTLALTSKVIGATETYDGGKTLRLYVHWEGRSDIDLSGFALSKTNDVLKVGWNASHHAGAYIVYSGDNTGLSERNAEYLDINTAAVPDDVEWIIVEARIYRGPNSFAGYNGTAHIGWMSRDKPTANKQWLPKTLERAMVLTNDAKVAYLMAYHPPSRQIVFLDMSMGSARVSTAQDAIRMRIFLEKIASVGGDHEVSWKRLNQGHILELLSGELAPEPEHAEVVFDEQTTAEQVSRLMTLATGGSVG